MRIRLRVVGFESNERKILHYIDENEHNECKIKHLKQNLVKRIFKKKARPKPSKLALSIDGFELPDRELVKVIDDDDVVEVRMRACENKLLNTSGKCKKSSSPSNCNNNQCISSCSILDNKNTPEISTSNKTSSISHNNFHHSGFFPDKKLKCNSHTSPVRNENLIEWKLKNFKNSSRLSTERSKIPTSKSTNNQHFNESNFSEDFNKQRESSKSKVLPVTNIISSENVVLAHLPNERKGNFKRNNVYYKKNNNHRLSTCGVGSIIQSLRNNEKDDNAPSLPPPIDSTTQNKDEKEILNKFYSKFAHENNLKTRTHIKFNNNSSLENESSSSESSIDGFNISEPILFKNNGKQPSITGRKPHEYSKLSPVISQPKEGSCIAFKMATMGLDYAPTISQYIEGIVKSSNIKDGSLVIEIKDECLIKDNEDFVGRFDYECEAEHMNDNFSLLRQLQLRDKDVF